MNARDLASRIVEALERHGYTPPIGPLEPIKALVEKTIIEARSPSRGAVIDECARTCEEISEQSVRLATGKDLGALRCRDAIRALKSEKPAPVKDDVLSLSELEGIDPRDEHDLFMNAARIIATCRAAYDGHGVLWRDRHASGASVASPWPSDRSFRLIPRSSSRSLRSPNGRRSTSSRPRSIDRSSRPSAWPAISSGSREPNTTRRPESSRSITSRSATRSVRTRRPIEITSSEAKGHAVDRRRPP